MPENRIQVNTGAKTYTIYDSDDEVLGRFKFNPSDFGIIQRAEKVQETLSGLKLGENTDDLFKFDKIVKEQFDFLLNYSVSDTLFAKATPTTLLESGELFFENVFDAITGLINESVQSRTEMMKKRIQEATASYTTGT